MSGQQSAVATLYGARGTGHAVLRVVLAVAVMVLLVKAVLVTAVVAETFAFPFQVDDAEGVVLAEATLIAAGINPYALQPSPAPYFYAGPYPPLYTLVNTAAVATLGPTFKVGRAVQLLATLGVGAWLAWAVAWSGRGAGRAGVGTFRAAPVEWIAGAWAALLWLSAHLVAVWAVLVRPDMTALAFNLLGVAVLRRWWAEEGGGSMEPVVGAHGRAPSPDGTESAGGIEAWQEGAQPCAPTVDGTANRSWPRGAALVTLAAGAACFALGWWTKQTFIIVPLAFLVVLLWSRPRAAVVLGAMYAALVAVPFAVLTAATGGGFAQKIVGYQGSWEWTAFRRLAEPFTLRYGLWLLLAALAAVVFILRRGPEHPLGRFAAVWFAGASVAALGAGTSGGNHNHFVELLAAAALLVGQGAASALHGATRDNGRGAWSWRVGVVVGVVLLTGVAAFEREGQHGWLARQYTAPTAAQEAGYIAVADYLANVPGPVYSDNVGILVVARQRVRVTDPFTMAAAVRLGRWDDAAVVADVAAGRYAAIALRCYPLDAEKPPTDATPSLIRAVQTRYRLAERNVLCVYVPR